MQTIHLKFAALSIIHPILNEKPTTYVIKNLSNLNGKLTGMLFDIIKMNDHHMFYFTNDTSFVNDNIKSLQNVFLFDPHLTYK